VVILSMAIFHLGAQRRRALDDAPRTIWNMRLTLIAKRLG
jgi:hypothetical protein